MQIIHRDIKMNNILVSNDAKTFKLADFGSSAQLASSTEKETKIIGTLGYYAPEILAGVPYGVEIDVFSLGSLLYALLTFRLPFFEDGDKLKYK
mmetsp:Transcript_14666/g.18434  ORF Transcript_14666/g.18434 Transcript_14666/m.18434 type:complete len:94 (-) Transcript_14666:243-524(-)